MATLIPFVVSLTYFPVRGEPVEPWTENRVDAAFTLRQAQGERELNVIPFDKLRTGFDRALLSKVEGLRANGCNYQYLCDD